MRVLEVVESTFAVCVSQIVSERIIVRYGHVFCVHFGTRLTGLERGQRQLRP